MHTDEEIIEFYKTHSGRATAKQFEISRTSLNKLLQKYNIPIHAANSAISMSCKGREPWNKGEKESQKHVYYTNGEKNIRILETDTPPEGYRRGRVVSWSDETKQNWKEHMKAACLERYGDKNYNNYEKSIETKIDKYGNYLPTYNCINSGPNIEFKKLLIDNNIKINNIDGKETRIGRFAYDFDVEDKILIEINPYAFHNVTFHPFSDDRIRDKNYHLNKTKLAIENGYRCISIWDWDDKDKIIQLLKPMKRIYARECRVQEVGLNETMEFINTYHLQGYAKDKIRVGLYFDGKLVSIMTFGKPRYNNNYEYELIRYCSCHKVIGGAQKIFKYFITNYNPNSIISYCDLSKFTGEVYETLGFYKKSVKVSKHWYNPKENIHITDNLLRQRGFDQLLGDKFEKYGKGTSNSDLMLQHGFVEIYDCGQATYIFINKK